MSTYERVQANNDALEDDLDLSFDDRSDDARTSTELRRHDQRMIEDDEEVEKLLIEQRSTPRKRGLFGRQKDDQDGSVAIRGGRSMHEKRNSERDQRNSSGETLYKMEEGGQRTSGESSGNSSDVDLQRLLGTQQFVQVGLSLLTGKGVC